MPKLGCQTPQEQSDLPRGGLSGWPAAPHGSANVNQVSGERDEVAYGRT